MELVKLGSVIRLYRGVSYKKEQAYKKSSERLIPIFRANNISNGDFNYNDLVYVSDKLINDNQYIHKGDIVITMSSGSKNHVGKVAIARENLHCAYGAFCGKIECIDIYPEYLLYVLMAPVFRTHIETCSKGTNINNLKQSYITEFMVYLPSFEEQQRIVERIEELFSELDKAEEILLKTKAQLEVYKQAVLKEAFAHSEEWQPYKFVELMENIKNGYGIKPTDDGKYPILKISAVRPMHIALTEIRYNKEPFEEAFLVHENDLLVTRYNGSKDFVGCCGVVSNIKGSIGYPDKLIRCRPKIKNQWHSKFIQYYISQGEAREFIRSKIKTTSGQNGLAGGDLKKVTVKVPDLSIQKAIVENIEEKLIAFENIDNTVNVTLLQVKSLRQSILKEAFEGKLV